MSILNQYKHTGKEFISELGVDSYDFSARFLAPLTGRFDSPDPKAWDYTWLSPYVFCAADPINSSDPTGMDTWKIDNNGEIIEHLEHKGNDILIRTEQYDEYGQPLQMELPYGTLKCFQASNGTDKFYFFKIDSKDLNLPLNIYEFLCDGSNVEWSNLLSDNYSYISTSNSSSQEIGGSIIAETLITNNNVNFKYLIHSHPSGTLEPSGDNYEPYGDVNFAQRINSISKNRPDYYILDPHTKRYTQYYETSNSSQYNNSKQFLFNKEWILNRYKK